MNSLDQSIHLGHAREGKLPREQSVHGTAETEKIRPRINLLPVELLG